MFLPFDPLDEKHKSVTGGVAENCSVHFFVQSDADAVEMLIYGDNGLIDRFFVAFGLICPVFRRCFCVVNSGTFCRGLAMLSLKKEGVTMPPFFKAAAGAGFVCMRAVGVFLPTAETV